VPVDSPRYNRNSSRRRQQDPPDPSGGGSDNPLGIDPLPEYVPPGTEIGVPPGYSTDVDISDYTDIFGDPWGGGGKVNRRPIYQDGDELLPANYGPDKIADLQEALAEVGLLPAGSSIRFKVWDDTSQQAFAALLAYANQNGLHWTTALNKLRAAQDQGGGAFTVDENGRIVPVGSDKELLPTSTTPKEELEPVFRQAVIDTLGQAWGEDQIQSMVSAYQQEEIARQRQAYAAEGTTNNVEQMPSPEAFIQQKAYDANPGRAQAESGLKYIDEFQQLLGQWRG